MTVHDFKLPPSLRRQGFGTWFLWSKIYGILPEEVRSNLLLCGELSSEDAKIEQTDENGIVRREIRADSLVRVPVMVDNIERRNQFLRRMLRGVEIFKYNKSGSQHILLKSPQSKTIPQGKGDLGWEL